MFPYLDMRLQRIKSGFDFFIRAHAHQSVWFRNVNWLRREIFAHIRTVCKRLLRHKHRIPEMIFHMYWVSFFGLESLFEEKGHQRESQWMQWEKWKSRDSFVIYLLSKWVEKITELKYFAQNNIKFALETVILLLMVLDKLECRWCHDQQKVNIKIKSHSSHDWAKIVFFQLLTSSATFTLSILDGKKRNKVFFRLLSIHFL